MVYLITLGLLMLNQFKININQLIFRLINNLLLRKKSLASNSTNRDRVHRREIVMKDGDMMIVAVLLAGTIARQTNADTVIALIRVERTDSMISTLEDIMMAEGEITKEDAKVSSIAIETGEPETTTDEASLIIDNL